MIERLNINIFKYINHFADINPILNNIAIIIAKYLIFIFILWIVYLWFRRGREYKKIAIYSIYSFILGFLFNLLISFFYYHPRPFMIHLGKLLIQHVSETSFPSDHTTIMLSIAFLSLYFKETRKEGLILSIFGFISGMARVFCGVHFPLDIIGSLVVALLSSFIIYRLQNKLNILNQIIATLYFRIVKK